MNTRTPLRGHSAPHVPNTHVTDNTVQGNSVLPNNLAERAPAQRLTPSDVMMLQRSAGNRAVQRLLQPGKAPHSLPPSPAISRAPASPLIQAKIHINNVEHIEETDPVAKWTLTPPQVSLYKELITSGEIMRFKDEAGMLDFLKHYASWYAKHPENFRAQASGNNTAPIESATAGAAKSEGGEVRSEIEVSLPKGVKEKVNVFSSEKRHLLDAFTQNRGKPPDAKINNSICIDATAFTTQLKEYADAQANALVEHRMLQGFRPGTVEHTSPTVSFKTDQAELPNESYDRHNAIHSFPNSGSLVYSPSQVTYAMIANVASYLYQTDDYMRARGTDPKGKRRHRTGQLEGWKRNKNEPSEVEDKSSPSGKKTIYPNMLSRQKAKRGREEITANMTAFTKYGFTPDGDPKEVAKKFASIPREEKGAVFGAINNVVDSLASLAFSYGAIAEVDKTADLSVPVGEAAANYQDLQTDPIGKPVIDAMVAQFKPKVDVTTLASTTPNRSQTRSMKYKNAKDAQFGLNKPEKNAKMEDKIVVIQKLYKLLEASGVNYKVDM